MPLPANVTTVTVLGTFLTPEGNPSTGTITFTPSSWLTNSGANVAIPNSAITKTLGTAGNFSVLLPITDDPDLSPSGWVYNVSEVVDGVSQNYNILLPGTVAVGGTVYLADLVPAAPAGPEYYSLASSLTIGTVTTVATGGSATATITGLAPSQVLNLGIPTGATGTVASAGSGSVGTAAVAPQGDPDTGIYFPAANQVAVTTGGTQALLLSAGAVSNPTFTGVATFATGTVTAPAITTTGDTNTGIFFPAADTVAIAEGGVEVLRVNSSGQASFPDGSASAPSITNTGDENTGLFFPAADTVSVATGGSERVRVDSSGRVGIGTGSDSVSTTVHISGSGYAGMFLGRRTDVASVSTALYLDTSTSGNPALRADAGSLQVFTGAVVGSSGGTERMRIDSNGLITGTGTSLGAWTTYTPTLGGSGWALGNGNSAGWYCQIGKIVTFKIIITFGSTTTAGAGGLTLTLPVTGASGRSGGYPIGSGFTDVSAGATYVGASVVGSTSVINVRAINSAIGVITPVTTSAPFTWGDTDLIQIAGTYEAA